MGYNQLQNGSMCNAHGKSISNCISVLAALLHSGEAGTWISAAEEILAFHMLFSWSIRKQQNFVDCPPPAQWNDFIKIILDQLECCLDKK